MENEAAGSMRLRPGGWSYNHIVTLLTRRRGRPAALVVIVVLAAFHIWLGERYWQPVHHLVFDTYQRLFPRQVDERFPVMIVDIDEASLAAFGQWPWPRTRLARLIDTVRNMGALAVGLDMVMPEMDRLSPAMCMAERSDLSAALQEKLAELPSNEVILAETLRRVPTVVGRVGLLEPGRKQTLATGQTSVRISGDTSVAHVQTYVDHLTNVSPLEEAAAGHGYLNAFLDADGVVRTAPLLLSVQEELAPALALELVRVAVGQPWYEVHGDPRGVRGVRIGTSFIPTDVDGRLRLYYTPPDGRRRVSALAVLNGEAKNNALAQRVAIIGVTGVGLTDIKVTPVTSQMDGVEVQAQVVENILAKARLVRPSAARWVELAVFLVVAVSFTLFLPRLPLGLAAVVCLVVAALLVAGSLAYFVRAQLLFDPSFPVAGNTVIVMVLLVAGFAAVDRARQELKAALEVERMAKLRIAGELKAAREIQMGMVPAPEAIKDLPATLAFHALLEPAEEVGGDLYDALMLDAHRFFFLIGDVSGKGVPASLFMALSKTLCKSAALREHMPMHELMSLVNEELSRENAVDLFVAAVVGIIDISTGVMELCNAGHEAPILLRPGKAPDVLETAGGPPLCVLEDFPYTSEPIQLQAGDTLVMVTDGVTEARDPNQNFYGLERTLAYLTTVQMHPNGPHSVAAICQGLYGDVKLFANGAAPTDDITIVSIRFTAPPLSPPTN
jgi:adenylate cyclase